MRWKKIIQKLKSRSFWEQGASEAISFTAAIPVVVFVTVMAVSIIQLGIIKERLEYTVYSACRAAVVCEDYDKALKASKEVASQDLARSGAVIDTSSLSGDYLTLKVIQGTGSGTKKKASSKKSSSKNWKKGNYVECTLKVKVNTMVSFLGGTKTCSKIMLIERPAEYDISGLNLS